LNKTDLFEKLDYYLGRKELARRVALSGYLNAMKHHRAANLIDFVFRSLQIKINSMAPSLNNRSTSSNIVFKDASLDSLEDIARHNLEGYTETGFHMRLIAKSRDRELAAGLKEKQKKKQN
jgi:hypothetical protein